MEGEWKRNELDALSDKRNVLFSHIHLFFEGQLTITGLNQKEETNDLFLRL